VELGPLIERHNQISWGMFEKAGVA